MANIYLRWRSQCRTGVAEAFACHPPSPRDQPFRRRARCYRAVPISEPVKHLGVVAPTPGVARPVLEAVGEQRLCLIKTASTEDGIDQHLLEEITLGMAAADPTDGVPNREQFFNGPRVIPPAMREQPLDQRQPRFACD